MPSKYIHIEAVLPDAHFLTNTADETARELRAWLQGTAAQQIINEYEATVERWDHKPSFPATFSEPFGTRMELYVRPVGAGTTNWQRVSDGTGPRMIVSGKGIMKFQVNYNPHTKAGGQWGGPGARSGEWKQARVVGPHRIEPREFSKKIRDKLEKRLQAEGLAIIAKALK